MLEEWDSEAAFAASFEKYSTEQRGEFLGRLGLTSESSTARSGCPPASRSCRRGRADGRRRGRTPCRTRASTDDSQRPALPVDLVQLYLDRIERIDQSVGSLITVAADSALAEAKEAESKVNGSVLPPFHGIPVVLKDVVDTAGIRSTYGSGAWKDRVPDRDHAVVTKLKSAGFIVLGKTKTPEFSGGMVTEPIAFGPCRNPWDLSRTCGGSSGGSGAAMAARLSSIALGGDDGGSIRIPSNWNGIFGIKPSRGRVSCAPDPSAMHFTNGPMALSVADAAAMLDAISGYVTGDGFGHHRPLGRSSTRWASIRAGCASR